MPVKVAQLAFIEALAAPGKDGPPQEFRVFRKGLTRTSKGIFNFSDESARSVIEAAHTHGNDYPIDYNHAMHHHPMFVSDPATHGKAAGWFQAELRDGELWATKVQWTPTATKMLADREYRYFSPTFGHTEDGEVVELLSIALTNTPATYGMEPLMASQLGGQPAPQEAPAMKSLLAMLGLKDSASEVEALEALKAFTNLTAELSKLTGKGSSSEILGVVSGWKAGAEQTAVVAAKLNAVETSLKEASVVAMLTKAVEDGKVAPAQKDALLEAGRKDPKWLEGFLSAAPVIAPGAAGGAKPPKDTTTTVTLTAEDREVAKQIGISEKDFAASKARFGGQVPEKSEDDKKKQ